MRHWNGSAGTGAVARAVNALKEAERMRPACRAFSSARQPRQATTSEPEAATSRLSPRRRRLLAMQTAARAARMPQLNPERPRPNEDEAYLSRKHVLPPMPSHRMYPRFIMPVVEQGGRAYDLAREIIASDRAEREAAVQKHEALLEELQQTPSTSPSRTMQVRDKKRFIERLRVGARIHDPEVRWRWSHGDYDLKEPVYRYLAHKEWANSGRLRLLQRLTQMKVIPDTLAHFDPQMDVRVWLSESEAEQGAFVDFADGLLKPRMEVVPFDATAHRLTALLLDPDTPDVDRQTYTTSLLWGVSDVEISVADTLFDPTRGHEWASFTPPEMIEGGPIRRLALFVFEQQAGSDITTPSARTGFNVRDFAAKNRLRPVGGFMYRMQWQADAEEKLAAAGLPVPKVRLAPISWQEAKVRAAASN